MLPCPSGLRPLAPCLRGAAALLACIVVAGASTASAQFDDGRNPIAYAGRSMTLDEQTLRIDLGPRDYAMLGTGTVNTYWGLSPRGFVFTDRRGPSWGPDPGFGFGLGAAYGIVDSLEVGATLIPIIADGGARFGDAEAYIRWRFLDVRVFEMGIQAGLQAPFRSNDFATAFGIPMALFASQIFRLDFGVEFEWEFPPGGDDFHIDIPFAFVFSPHRIFFIGPRAGLWVWDFSGDDADISFMAGGFLGFTVPFRQRPFVDITFSFLWPHFLTTYRDHNFWLDQWILQFGANFHISLR
jgi:hypothetical protein